MDALNDARNATETLRNQMKSQVQNAVLSDRRIDQLEKVVENLNEQVITLASKLKDVTENFIPSLESAFAPLAAMQQLRLYT